MQVTYISNYKGYIQYCSQCWEQYLTSPGDNTPRDTNYTDTCPPITKTIQVRRTRHAGHCWRSKDELISDVLLWTPTYGCAKAGRPARTYIQQLFEDTGCNTEDLPKAMNDREKWRERVRDICAGGTTWWWWWWWQRIYVDYLKRFVRLCVVRRKYDTLIHLAVSGRL